MVLPRDSTAYYKKVNHVKTNVAATGNIPEGAVFFRPGMVPPQRQIYYQVRRMFNNGFDFIWGLC